MKINSIDGLFNSLRQKHNNYHKNWKQKSPQLWNFIQENKESLIKPKDDLNQFHVWMKQKNWSES
jgi:hypothetical protein